MTFFDTLESLPLSVWIREAPYGFHYFVAAHLIGIMLSAGLVAWFDLRLLGISMTRVPVSVVYRRLMPVAFAGFAIMFTTGGILLAAYANNAFPNTFFRLKVAAIVLAGVNALVYHRLTERTIAAWDAGGPLPFGARVAGLCSIALWASVILLGRAMSYTMF